MCTCFIVFDNLHNDTISSILGKSIQHVHRYEAFLQTIEDAYDVCTVYVERFTAFPGARTDLDDQFVERIEGIFGELFAPKSIPLFHPCLHPNVLHCIVFSSESTE